MLSYLFSIKKSFAITFMVLINVLIIMFSQTAKATIIYTGSSSSSNNSLPTNGAAGTITINKPSGTATGQALIATLSVRPRNTTVTIPSGWTLMTRSEQSSGGGGTAPGGMTLLTYYHIVSAGEPASYSWTFANPSNTGGSVVGGILAFSGIDTSTGSPVNVWSQKLTNSGTTHSTNSITPTKPNTMIISSITYLSGSSFANPTGISGVTERIDQRAPAAQSASGTTLQMSTVSWVSPTATGSIQAVAEGGSSYSDSGIGHIMALESSEIDPAISVNLNSTITAGGTGSYTLTISNNGTLPEPGAITVTNTLPSALTYNAAGSGGTGWVCSSAAQVITCTHAGALAADTSASPITINFNVSPSASGTVTNTATVSGTGGDGNTTNNTDTNTTTISIPAYTLIARYYMDENITWSGKDREIEDFSGNSYDAKSAKKTGTALAINAFSSPAISGTTGTCGYGVFNGSQFIDIPTNFPNITNSLTIAAWIKTTDRSTTQRIFCDDQNNTGGYCLSLSDADAGNGALKFFRRSSSKNDINLKTSTIIQNNTWYFVAVSVNANASQATLYVYNQAGALVATPTTASMGNLSFIDSGSASIGGENLASAESAGFRGNIDEVSVYNGALSQTEIETLRATTRSCPNYISNVNASTFNCISKQESTSGTNVSTGRLYTQLVNIPFDIKVVALKSNGNAETNFSAASDRTAVLKFRDQTTNALINFSGGETANSKNVLFNTSNTTGIVDVTGLSIPQSYKNLKCEISEGAISASPSSDNFSVRPYQLLLSTSNAGADINGASTTATPAIKAGTSFNLTAKAIKSATVTDFDTGYDGTPIAHSTLNDTLSPKVIAHTGAVTKGLLAGTFGQAVAGVATGNFTYDEVGYFKLNQYAFVDYSFTTVDQSGGDCLTGSSAYAATADASGKIGCYLYSPATNYFGRFTPDHFEISNISSPSQCGSFNYYGQEFPTSFKITAKDHPSINTTTQNYTGSFAKLGLTTWSSGYNFSATGLPVGASLTSGSTAPSGTWSSGVATITATHKIDRLANPMLPATVNINAAPTDADNITTASTALVSNVPFKYGRIYFPNTFGSELLPLIVPIQVQYWNGLAYALNISDSCTNLSNTNFGMSNYKSNLSGSPICETKMTSVIKTSLGLYTALLSPPGWGNTGSVDLTLFTNNTAVGNTCTGITPTTATSRNYPWFGAPKAKRATFGIFKSPIIYMHENF